MLIYLKQIYGGYTIQQGNTLSYLGMSVQRDLESQRMIISQSGYIDELQKKYRIMDSAACNSPYTTNFLTHDANCDPCDKAEFLSLVMSMMFIARMTRPDILFSIVYLATKSTCPSNADIEKGLRVRNYLVSTSTYGILITGGSMQLSMSVDASHGLHCDGKGHSGCNRRTKESQPRLIVEAGASTR